MSNEKSCPVKAMGAEGEPAFLDELGDVMVPVEVRIGNRSIPLAEIAALAAGDTIPFDRQIGEPLDVFVGGMRLATGEVAAIQNRLAVRITSLDLGGFESGL